MTPALLGATWAGWVLLAAWRRRPVRRRPLVGRRERRPQPRLDPRHRRLGCAVLAGAALLPVLPIAAPAAGVVAWAVPLLRRRRSVARAAAEVRRSLPEVVDLVALAVGSGCNVVDAVEAVGRRGAGPVAAGLAAAAAEIRLGRRCADVLDDLPARLGEPVRPLAAALAASERYGAPLAGALDRLAAELRADRRRAAEAAARQVPVKLLFPLVLCVLPAFGLLTVAPLLAGALGSLRP